MCCACAAKSKFSKQTAELAGRNVTILTMKVAVLVFFFFLLHGTLSFKKMIHCKNHKHKSLIHKSTSKFSDLLVFKQSSSSGCFVFFGACDQNDTKEFFFKDVSELFPNWHFWCSSHSFSFSFSTRCRNYYCKLLLKCPFHDTFHTSAMNKSSINAFSINVVFYLISVSQGVITVFWSIVITCRLILPCRIFTYCGVFLTMWKLSSSGSASLLVLKSTGTSCIRDNILAAAFLLASFLEVPLPVEGGGNQIMMANKHKRRINAANK